jgi:hypothetical protein
MRLNRRGRNGPFVDQFEMGNKSALSALDRMLGYVVGSRDVLLFSNLLFYNSYLVVAVATCYSFLEVTG